MHGARLAWPLLVSALIACTPPPQAQPASDAPHEIDELWQEPTNLAERDLLLGPGGASITPPANGSTFEFVSYKIAGTNPGYDLRDATGRMWSVKLGVEAQPEVTSSRILWAIGFHQPPQYFVNDFTVNGIDRGGRSVTHARFRTEVAHWKSAGDWSWYANPFLDSTPLRGLVVAQLILNNWDLKTPNNRYYEAVTPDARLARLYMVRDLGASLGYAKQFRVFTALGAPGGQGTKSDIDGFEQQNFITRVERGRILFDYRGMHQALVNRLTIADVLWTCDRLARISDEQWQAAFLAGGYDRPVADRYIKKIKAKIAQGLALKARPTS